MIKRCTPAERTYTPEDLHWLYSIQERIGDFGPTEIKKIVSIVTHNRFAGLKADDERMKIDVDRAYQETKRAYEQELEKAKILKKNAETETEKVSQQLSSTESELKILRQDKLLRQATLKLIKNLCWRIPLAVFISFIIFHLANFAFDPTIKSNWLDILIAIVTGLGFAYGLVRKSVEDYLTSKKQINSL